MNFFWPTEPNPDPGFLGRFGRLVHWLSAAILALCLYAALQSTENAWVPVFWGSIVYLIGRATRFLFAAE